MESKELETFLREIKGAAASVLWALLLSGERITSVQLQQRTGYTRRPVAGALSTLSDKEHVKYLGHRQGWSLSSSFLSFLYAVLPTTEDNNAENGTKRTGRLPVVDDHDLDQGDRINHQQEAGDASSGNGRKGAKADEKEDLALGGVLEELDIRGRAYQTLQQSGVEAAVLRGWWWYALAQPWIVNPAGYVISCVRADDLPPPGFLTLAREWSRLTEAERETVSAAARGVVDHRVVAGRAQDGRELRDRLEADFCPALDAAALQAYLELNECAPQVLEPR